jgi:thiol-disulfide isomerase/thioredoxin
MLLRILFACAFSGLVLPGQTTSPILRTPADAEKLEAESDAQPDDVSLLVRLMRYYFQQGAQSADRMKPLRRKHIVWMIEHRPDHVVLSESAGTIDRSGNPLADADAYAAADAAWRKELAGGQALADTFANAAAFYKVADPSFARKLVEDGLKSYPGNNRIAGVKGALLAYSILGVKLLDPYGRASSFDDALAKSSEAARARNELQDTTDPNLLGGAAAALSQQSYPLSSRNLTAKLKEVEDLTAHLYQRAIELDPNNARWKSGLMSAYQSLAMQKKAPAEKIELLEKAAGMAPGAVQRAYVLTELSQSYFNAGNTAKASETANELVNTAENKSDWNYGNAIHIGNIVLGRIALKQGNVEEAGRYLLAAGRTPGSPQLNSFGPNWNLAQDLIGRGDRASVLAYLDLCRNFWKSDKGRLDSYAATIRGGGTPNFFGPPEIPRRQLIGSVAPDFRLKDLKGAEVALSESKGKVVLIDFWATWCAPCRQEMPDFQNIHRELSGQDVVVLAVDVDEPQDTVAEYIDKEKYTFPVLLSAGSDVVAKYSVSAYPTVFAVDKSGRIAEILVGGGADNASRLNAAIGKARAGAPPAAPVGSATASAAPGALVAPKLLSPSDGAVFEHFPRLTTLVWGEVAGAAGYMVEWDYKSSDVWTSDVRGTAAAFRTTEPVFVFQFAGAQPGRWRVWAVDANGNAGPKSGWREFRYTK